MTTLTRALLLSASLINAAAVGAQSVDSATPKASGALDGPAQVFRDSLLEHFVGPWNSRRTSSRQTMLSNVEVDWVLNHQFLRIHYFDSASSSSYEAMVFIGYDHTSDRYVAHWMDVGGGRWSETLGYGTRVANGIRFVFEYPDGPFVNTYTFDAAQREWRSTMQQKNKSGAWVSFADETFRRR